MKVLQIIPKRQGVICGVRDQTQRLSKQLTSHHEMEVAILELDESIASLSKLSQASMGCDAIILQYSAYGYQKRGFPRRLWSALSQGIKHGALPPLLTMFHELHASGPMTSTGFWYGIAQRVIIQKLIRLSSGLRTNRQAYRKKISSWLPQDRDIKIITQPIFSNFGESDSDYPNLNRRNQLLIFQPPCTSNTSQQVFWKSWKKLNAMLHPETTVIVGRHGNLPTTGHFDTKGIVSDEEACQIFSESKWGLMNYYSGFLAKSSGFAAHAAHSIITFMPHDMFSTDDGLFCNTHYYSLSSIDALPPERDQKAMALALNQWYSPHSIKATAKSYTQQLHQILPAFV